MLDLVGLPISLMLAAIAGLLLLLYRRIGLLTASVGSERRQLQEELDRREEYVAALARELGNPIAAITYAARALGSRRATLDVPSVASGIAAEAESAAQLVRQLTDAARIESRHLHLALAPVDLAAVTRDTISSFDPGQEHTVTLEAPRTPVVVHGDAAALAKVLRYLISNAVTYSPPGPVEVRIDRDAEGQTVRVAVIDEGPGVPPSERHLLFRKFARLSTAGGTVGAGLGLFLARAIVEEHGGALSAEWPSEGGSHFWFTVPNAAAVGLHD